MDNTRGRSAETRMRPWSPTALALATGLGIAAGLLPGTAGAQQSGLESLTYTSVLQRLERNAKQARPALAQASSDDTLLIEEDKPAEGDSLLVEEEKPAEGDSLLVEEEKPSEGDSLLSEEEKPSEGDSLLQEETTTTQEQAPPAEEEKEKAEGERPLTAAEEHARLFEETNYPSANTCATCHPKQYKEWSVSQHAYAQLSPVYMAMQITINELTSYTNGDFCIRCHTQVGMNRGEHVSISNLDRHPASREGITCVVCHRVAIPYGKISGRFALEEGDLFEPVYGPTGDEELKRVLSKPEEYRVVTERGKSGRIIHTGVERFFDLVTPAFCGSCHDVNLVNGFRLEEAFSHFKRAPAAQAGVSCQDCHMGAVQGANKGYETGPAAIVGGVPTTDRRITNHYFAGPDYSIIHPGIFPHNTRAAQFKTLREWLQFDWEAGWGTDKFEDSIDNSYQFPEAWQSIDDRYDARDIISEQLETLAWAEEKRLELLRNGYGIGEIEIKKASADGIKFVVPVRNLTDGHFAPTGFDAERLVFLEVTVTDQDGKVVYVSGDRDPNGDVRDQHSLYVHNGELPVDKDLLNLQSKFVVRLLRGGEREQILAVNKSVDAQPFVRPEARPTILYGRNAGARKHRKGINPLGHVDGKYTIDGDKLTGRGPYNVKIRLISQMIPVNLVTAIQGAAFDYNMSAKEVAENVVKGASVVDEREFQINVEGGS